MAELPQFGLFVGLNGRPGHQMDKPFRRLKICCSKERAGSTPARGTNQFNLLGAFPVSSGCASAGLGVYPELGTFIDYDPEQAGRTRRELFGRYSDSSVLFCTAHFPGTSVGRIVTWKDAF